MSGELATVSDPTNLGTFGGSVGGGGGSGQVAEWNADHEAWLRDNPYKLRDIGRQNVTHKDMSGINLDRVTTGFSKSNFSNNIFDDATFVEATIDGNFSNSTMHRANMTDAQLRHSDFSNIQAEGLDLTRANLYMADFAGSTLINPVMKEAEMGQISFWGATIEGLDLSGRGVGSNNLIVGANFKKATLHNANFSNIYLAQGDFSEAVMPGADFSDSMIVTSTMRGADLRGANFTNASGRGRMASIKFNDADIRGADFTGYGADDFKEENFKGAKYSDDTVFPKDVDPEKLGMIRTERSTDPLPVPLSLTDRLSQSPLALEHTFTMVGDGHDTPFTDPTSSVTVGFHSNMGEGHHVPAEGTDGVKDRTPGGLGKFGFTVADAGADWSKLVKEEGPEGPGAQRQ